MKKQTLNKDGTPRKTGSGRTKGAASTILVKLSDVNEDNMDKVWDLLRFIETGEADIWE